MTNVIATFVTTAEVLAMGWVALSVYVINCVINRAFTAVC